MASTTARASVVGGYEADPAVWPFVVALVKTSEADTFQAQFCGGAVVRKRAVVTAAHCVTDLPKQAFHVVTGGTLNLGQPRFEVQTVAIHPAYRGGIRVSHDLAILTFAQLLGRASVPWPILGRTGRGRPRASRVGATSQEMAATSIPRRWSKAISS